MGIRLAVKAIAAALFWGAVTLLLISYLSACAVTVDSIRAVEVMACTDWCDHHMQTVSAAMVDRDRAGRSRGCLCWAPAADWEPPRAVEMTYRFEHPNVIFVEWKRR